MAVCQHVTGRTRHGLDCPDPAVRVMKNGATDYVKKPFPSTGNTLDKAIREALGIGKHARTVSADEPKVTNTGLPTRFEGGELVFFPNRVELCGVVVLGGRCLMRRILEELRVRHLSGKYVAIGGAPLAKKLGILRGKTRLPRP